VGATDGDASYDNVLRVEPLRRELRDVPLLRADLRELRDLRELALLRADLRELALLRADLRELALLRADLRELALLRADLRDGLRESGLRKALLRTLDECLTDPFMLKFIGE
jgi:uncharacterized protein YjbI with pentapeptide repeats